MTISEAVYAELADAARRGAAQAYCPYSHFRVGAAVLTDDGRIPGAATSRTPPTA